MTMYKHFLCSTLLFIFMIHASLATEHCPALSIKFSDFGIEGCPPSFTVNSPEEVEESLKRATCLGWVEWYLLPSIGCSSPIVPEGTVVEFPCECDFGGKCKISCLPGYELQGKRTFIECQEGGTWSSFPLCALQKCTKPNLPTTLTFAENCDFSEGKKCNLKCMSDEYRIHGGVPYIMCKDLKWSSFPECKRFCPLNKVPRYLIPKQGCAGNNKEICPVHCRNPKHTLNGENNIKCMESGEWSEMPICGCSSAQVPDNIILRKACSSAAGVSCEAVCGPSYYKKDSLSVLVCNEHGAWNLASSIKCLKMCPELVLPSGLEITNRCNARQGDVCKVKCTGKLMRLTEPETFYCLPTGKYSAMPGCAKVDQCSNTVLPQTVKFIGSCQYTYGETCSVGCKDSSFTLEGDSSITCTLSGTWSAIPDCVKYCPDLKLKPNQKFKDDAACSKKVGDTCTVICKENYAPTQPFHIKCSPEGKWDRLPDCQKMCEQPNFPDKVISLQSCNRVVDSVCNLGCQEAHLAITPTDKITCLKDAVWSEMPKCRHVCNVNEVPSGFRLVDCSQMFESEECDLSCIDPNEYLFGNRVVRCLPTGLLIAEDVQCVTECKELSIPDGLKPVNNPDECDYMKPQESCIVRCVSELAILKGDEKVFCLGNNYFSPLPTCEIICPELVLPLYTRVIGFCDKRDGSVCTVRCEQRKFHSNGTEYFSTHETTCKNGAWSGLPECEISCPPLRLSDTVRLRGECQEKNNERCFLECKETAEWGSTSEIMMVGDGTLFCQEGVWLGEDAYCAKYCGTPYLPERMYVSQEYECLRTPNTQCKVECEPPYVLTGSDAIICDAYSQWSAFPQCTLLCPNFELTVLLPSTCSRMPNEVCIYECMQGYGPATYTSIQCLETGQWSFEPNCQPERPKCVLPPHLVIKDSQCQLVPSGYSCTVRCTDIYAYLDGSPEVYCDSEGNIPVIPSCTSRDTQCSIPQESDNVRVKECYEPYTLFKRCELVCSFTDGEIRGNKVIMCEPPGQWSTWGDCEYKCSANLPRGQTAINGYCDRIRNTYCLITCDPININIVPDVIFCDENLEWVVSDLRCAPADVCISRPYIPNYLQEDNYNIAAFLLRCRESLPQMVGPPIIYCTDSGKWSDFPDCVAKKELESPPCNAEDHEFTGFSCPDTAFASQCTVLDNGCPTPTLRSAYCLSSGRWSSFVPHC